MIIIIMETMEIFDAFAFQQDWCHMLQSCASILKNKPTDLNYLSKAPGFSYFYIKCQQLNKLQSLDKAICSAAKVIKFNKSLINWITGATRPFLKFCEIKTVPHSWKPFTTDIAPYLYTCAQLSCLDGDCGTKMKTGRPCPCDIAKESYYKCNDPNLWPDSKLLWFTPTAVHSNVRNFIAPCVNSLRVAVNSTRTLRSFNTQSVSHRPTTSFESLGQGNIFQHGIINAGKNLIYNQPFRVVASGSLTMSGKHGARSALAKQPVSCSAETPEYLKNSQLYSYHYNSQGERLLCLENRCQQPAECYWVECCKPSEPICCKFHARRFTQSEKKMRMALCPKHNVTGKVAILLL